MNDDDNTNRIRFTRANDAPLRDQDNARPELKPAYANPAPNLAPPGMSGIKTGLSPRTHDPEQEEMRFLPEFEQSGIAHDQGIEVDSNTHTEGRVLTMPGYSFTARITDERTDKGINGGTIDQLVLKKDDRVVARYNQGWEKDADTPEQKEAVHRIRTGLGDTDKDKVQAITPDKGKAHDLDR